MPCENSARKRSKTMAFRCTPEEYELIANMAAWSGMSRQDYIMARLTGTEITVRPSSRTQRALRDSMKGLASGSSPCATPMSSMRTSKGSSPWSWRSSTGSARRRRPEGAQSARKGPATISSGCLDANPGPRLGDATASGRTRAGRRGEGPQARCVGNQGNQRQLDEKGIYYFHQKGGTL